jgi:hypothetical protein
MTMGLRLADVLEKSQEPGAAELGSLLHELLVGTLEPEGVPIRLERLKQEVYRLWVGDGGVPARTLVLKRLQPATAQTDRLVAERWLPALGMADRSPRLLGAAAARSGDWVWHVYEDIGGATLAADRRPERLAAAVALLVELHTRAAGHPLLPEIRWRARDNGAHFYTANLRDAVSLLEALAAPPREPPPGFAASRRRLLSRLQALLEDSPRRVGLLSQVAGPDTLLHGDLWPKNVFVTPVAGALRARLIDWDHVGAGPFSYDLSTFVYRSSPEERPWILRHYRQGAERAGWRLPGTAELNVLFHTAESARCAHCIVFDAVAILHGGAAWAFEELMDFECWLETLRPPLAD